ncbi:VWA domain-containing protein [Paraflavitalea sp. CAU 1676]|uniref:VWA domain-containing protein n=1 Tax=Paraflavitalea sp. CAU 1676 TaxID=3032598 RepID=UPI0023D9A75B|nr:VWA domain-containing protein [Paraflavitalea sp. CAU 1676]MDF2191585.1 VWA domain-containing protein [Paraflavitalea sp. CAU 1676]
MWSELEHIISSINWEQFHFLRPKALYLFIPLGIIAGLLLLGNRERKKWKLILPPALRPFMFTRGNALSLLLPLLLFLLGSTICIFALAGPAWEKKKIPGQKIEAVVLIALDLSGSMLATDIAPNRLERAKFKISDFLDANPRARVGLVAYAGTAHPVLPFTSDYKLIKHHAASLVNRIMPVQGSNLSMLVQIVDTMLRKVQAPSTLLLMTDAITSDDAALLTQFTQHSIHRIELLLLSTPAGAKVPGHPNITSKQEPTIINNLRQDTSIAITPLTLDTTDVGSIAARIAGRLVFEKDKTKDDKDWDDRGALLLVPALLITLFWFRKGWVLHWCWLPLVGGLLTGCGVNSQHPDWWYSKNYQAQLLENAGRYQAAAETFEDDNQKAIAYYKAGNFTAAADLWALDSSATATYNRALALARLGRYDEALTAFEEAGAKDPTLRQKATNGLTQTRLARQKADSIKKYDETTVSKKEKDLAADKKKEKKDPLKEHKPQGKDEQLSSDTRVKKLPKFGNRATDEVASDIHHGKEAKWPPKDQQQQQQPPNQTAGAILMRQVAADPSEFLHRRFELQEKRYYKHIPKPKEAW